nr:phage tail protein I [Ectothiorhodospira mobilis]
MLPPNATPAERALASAAARVSDVPVPVGDLWDPWSCPAELLPWLAWALSVDEWDSQWPEETRREVVARSIELHRHKGTVWAVRRALEALGVEPEIVEWWQPSGGDLAPFEFGLRAVLRRPITPHQLLGESTADEIRPRIDNYKPARSHLAWIAFAVRLPVGMPAPALTGARRVRRRSGLGVPILPTLDAWGLDGARLDRRALGQSRRVAVSTAAPVRLGRQSTLDQGLHLDSDGLDGQAMDRWLLYREAGRIPPLARLGVTAAARSPAPAGGAAAKAWPAARARSLAPMAAEAMHHQSLTAHSAAAVRRPMIRGLDHLPTLDAAPVDAAPLDISMETVNG